MWSLDFWNSSDLMWMNCFGAWNRFTKVPNIEEYMNKIVDKCLINVFESTCCSALVRSPNLKGSKIKWDWIITSYYIQTSQDANEKKQCNSFFFQTKCLHPRKMMAKVESLVLRLILTWWQEEKEVVAVGDMLHVVHWTLAAVNPLFKKTVLDIHTVFTLSPFSGYIWKPAF